jgi:hypothetical protein
MQLETASLPHHSLWLRQVLDQQHRGYSWPQYQLRFLEMLQEQRLYVAAFPVPRWAASDIATTINQATLSGLPVDVRVVCPGNGPDGRVTLRAPLPMDGIEAPGLRHTLPAGTQIKLEVGSVSPVLTHNYLTMDGCMARLPYDFESGVDPHLFILALREA